jgi:taurine transport system substrate-binding protein
MQGCFNTHLSNGAIPATRRLRNPFHFLNSKDHSMSLSRRHILSFGAIVTSLFISGTAAIADGKKVVVGYQTDALPSSVAIANGEFAKTTGYEIDFRKFNSGAEIFAAIASGDVQVGYVGSSPFAAAASRGLEVKAFYLASISGTDEALVVRNGSGIAKPADLKGKKLAAAPVSAQELSRSIGCPPEKVRS